MKKGKKAKEFPSKISDQINLNNIENGLGVLLEEDGCMLWKANQDTVFKYVSPKLTELLGYKDTSGKSFFDLMPEEERDRLKPLLLETINRNEKIVKQECTMKHSDGSHIFLEISAVPAFENKPELTEYYVIFRDITERKKIEQALKENEKRYRAIVDSQVDLVSRYLPDTNLTFVNDAYCRFFGKKREDLIGKSFMFMIAPEYRETVKRETEELAKNPRQLSGEYINYRYDGKECWIQWVIHCIFNEKNEVVELQAVGRDITSLKEHEKTEKELREQLFQSQKMETIGILAGGIAHDFNNLLTPIIGYTEMMQLDLTKEDRNWKILDQIREVSEMAKVLTRQLLTLSKKQILEPMFISVIDIIHDFEHILRSSIRDDIEISITDKLSGSYIYADKFQIQQSLLNLAVNAQDSMPGGGKLILEAKDTIINKSFSFLDLEIGPGEYVVFSMSDTGTGIDKETQKHIFEPFFSTKESGKGTGLGLSTVYEIIKQHNGSISVESDLNTGSTFRIFLQKKTIETAIVREEKGDNEHIDFGRGTVLVAEDNKQIRKLVARMLNRIGYDVLVSEKADQCIDIAKKYSGKINLLLTDVIMPVMNGRELYNRLKNENPSLKVIYMSGYTNDVIDYQGVFNDNTVFLQKPFKMTDLSQKIKKVMEE